MSLGRIILFVQDVEQLKKFYCWHFQFQVAEEVKDQWVVLKAGNCELALHKAGDMHTENNPDAAKRSNNVKLVFETSTDLSTLREELIRNNVTMRDIKSFGNSSYRFCDGIDMEGNVFQLMQKIS